MKHTLPNGDTVERDAEFRGEVREWHLPPVLPVPVEVAGRMQLVDCAAADIRAVNACFPPERPPFAVFALIGVGTRGNAGMFAPFDAEMLRDYAATFLRMADQIDNGRGKQ